MESAVQGLGGVLLRCFFPGWGAFLRSPPFRAEGCLSAGPPENP